MAQNKTDSKKKEPRELSSQHQEALASLQSKLRAFMYEKNMTQEQLAHDVGVNVDTIKNIFRKSKLLTYQINIA